MNFLKKKLYFLLLPFIFLGVMAYSVPGPKISLEKKTFDFGLLEEGQVKKGSLTIENVGSEDLVIDRVYADCGCTEVTVSAYNIKPGEKVYLDFTYNTEGKLQGEDLRSIYIISNDPVCSSVKIKISAQIIKRG